MISRVNRTVLKSVFGQGLVCYSILSLMVVAAEARAQGEVNASDGNPGATLAPVAPAVEWKAQSKGGFLLSSGNSQTQNITFGLNASRKEGNNKLALEGGMAYGKSKNLIAVTDASNTITGLDRQAVLSTYNWASKGRYDRFLSTNNSLYASALLAADKIAGKSLFGGGQLGYSRQLFQNDMHLVVVEAGYDFSYEQYIKQGNSEPDPVSIHSARIFIGETFKLTGETGLIASLESLINLNKESNALDASNGEAGVKAFGDTRLTGKLGLSTNLRKNLSVNLGFTFKYDQNPAPRPIPGGAPARAAYPLDHRDYKYSDTVDTITEATLIYTFF